MAQEDIRERLKTVISGVSGSGIVHDYERYNNDWSKFLDLFKQGNEIRGTMIIYQGFTQDPTAMDTCDIIRNHNWVVMFVLGLQDKTETEKTAADTVELLVNAIDSDSTLNGTTYVGMVPSQVEPFEIRQFGDVLCHYAEIRKTVPEEYNWNP